ncbi:MAG: oligosaccharide flippase family protein [Candidatus Tyrphobacter sp.]
MPTDARTMRHGGFLLGATVVGSAGFYVFRVVATHRLGVAEYGTLASLLAIVALTGFVSAFSTAIVARLTAQVRGPSDAGMLGRVREIVFVSAAAVLLLGLLCAAFASPAIARFLNGAPLWAVRVTIVLAALGVALAIVRGMLQGAQLFALFSLSQAIEFLGKAALASAAVLGGLSILGAMTGQTLAAFAAVVWTYAIVARRFRGKATSLGVGVRPVVVRSANIAATYLALAMLIELDLILAKHYLSPFYAGIYGVVVLPGRALATFISVLPTLLLPHAAEHAQAGLGTHPLLRPMVTIGVCVSVALLLLVWLAPAPVVGLIAGAQYAGAAPLLLPAVAAASFWGLTSIGVAYRAAFDRFAFMPLLAATVLLEAAAIVIFHRTPQTIVEVLLCANALGFAVTFIGIHGRRTQRAVARTLVSP